MSDFAHIEIRPNGDVIFEPEGENSLIFILPEEVRPEHIELHVVPMRADGSIHLDTIKFRAGVGDEVPDPDYYLAVWGDHYAGAPALYYNFDSPLTEAWLRFNWRLDVSGSYHALGLFMMGFLQNASSHDFSGSYPNNYDISPNISILSANGGGANWFAFPINAGNSFYSASVSGQNTLGTVIDLGCSYLGDDNIGTGTNASQKPFAKWQIDIYVDEVQKYSAIWGANAGPISGANKPLDQIIGLVIDSQYAAYSSPNHLAFDNIRVGTTRGATDILPTVTFGIGSPTLSPFLIDGDNDVGNGPNFEVIENLV